MFRRMSEPPTPLRTVPADRYQAGAVLARGGQGRVRRAVDRWLGREVAIKEPVSPSAARRLAQEALITARLQHPAIVPLYDAGCTDDGTPFYAMKLVDGVSLQAAIRAARGLADRLALLPRVIAVAEAVAYAHSRNIIHRDLKPSNVLVGAYGETVVIDWGLAKDLGAPDGAAPAGAADTADGPDSRDGHTVAGTVLGTPGYMAPEQARGEAVDARADVYALGAMLYQLFAGAAPVAGTVTYQTTLADGGLAPIDDGLALPREVPRDLATIVAKAMAFDPGQRYPSAAELAANLQRFQTGQLVSAQVYSPLALFRRWVRRHRAAVTVAALAATALIAIGALSLRQIFAERDRVRDQGRVAEQARRIADEQRAAAQQLVEFMLSELRDKLEGVNRLDLLYGAGEAVRDYYTATAAVEPLDAAARRRRAAALAVLARIAEARGDGVAARRYRDEALALREQLVAAAPGDADLRRELDELRELDLNNIDENGAAPTARDLRGSGGDAPVEIPLVVALWEDPRYRGRKRVIVRDEPNLGPGWARDGRCQPGLDFDDRASAVGVHPGPDYEAWKARHGGAEPQAFLWTEPGYRGRRIALEAGGYSTLATLGIDDAVSSVQLGWNALDVVGPDRPVHHVTNLPVVLRLHTAPRERAARCAEPDDVITLIQSSSYLAWDQGRRFDDSISWIEVLKGPDYDPGKTFGLYTELGYGGDVLHFLDSVGDLDLAALGIDDVVSGVRIQP